MDIALQPRHSNTLMILEYHIRFECLREDEISINDLSCGILCVLQIIFVAINEQVAPFRGWFFLMRR